MTNYYIYTYIIFYNIYNFYGSNVPEDGIEFESFTVISIDSLLVYENKYYLQLYLGSCTSKLQTNN